MDAKIREAIFGAFRREPFARQMGLELEELAEGRAVVAMQHRPQDMDNLFGKAHGGAIFGLIDGAFEAAAQTDGTVCVALNVNVTYVASPEPGSRLRAEAWQESRTRKTAGYRIEVRDDAGQLLASCQALAYRTGRPLPFL